MRERASAREQKTIEQWSRLVFSQTQQLLCQDPQTTNLYQNEVVSISLQGAKLGQQTTKQGVQDHQWGQNEELSLLLPPAPVLSTSLLGSPAAHLAPSVCYV